MAEWIPLFQTLVWPVFILSLLIIYRKPVQEIAKTVSEQIKKGAGFSIGPQGVSVGGAPKLREEAGVVEKQLESLELDEIPNIYQLAHTAEFARILEDGKNDYSITVWLESISSPHLLNKVTKVAYHLHSSYYPRDIREVTSPENNFELKFYAWGQFNLYAEIFTENSEHPIIVWRYINF